MNDTGLISQSELSDLKKLIDHQVSLEEQIDDYEKTLSELKQSLKQVSQVDIPDLLEQHGLSEIKLDDGRKVIVKSDVSVSVKDPYSFYQFLRDRKDDSIIKTQTLLIEPSKALLEELSEIGVEFTQEEKIHPQTLKAYFREFMSLGEEVPPSVSVYVYSKAKIK